MNDAQFRKKERLSHKNEAVSLFYGLSLLLFRRICHLKHEVAATHDLVVGDEVLVVGRSVHSILSTYMFSTERFSASMVNLFPSPTVMDTFGSCGAPKTSSPLTGLTG